MTTPDVNVGLPTAMISLAKWFLSQRGNSRRSRSCITKVVRLQLLPSQDLFRCYWTLECVITAMVEATRLR